MCKTLFRFEDKYGMHSIVTSFKGITKDASTDFYNVGDIYVQYGLSCIPCLCTADIIDECSVLGIDRVVLIFDLDGPMGGMLTYEDIKKRYTEISGVEILYYPVAWCAETLLHYQICSYVTDAEIYTVPKQVKILLQSIAGKNVKKTDAILDVPVLKQRLLEIDRQKLLDREIIEYLLGISNNAFTLSELEVWMKRATKKYNDNYGWWK